MIPLFKKMRISILSCHPSVLFPCHILFSMACFIIGPFVCVLLPAPIECKCLDDFSGFVAVSSGT